jgi:hypothetical protein
MFDATVTGWDAPVAGINSITKMTIATVPVDAGGRRLDSISILASSTAAGNRVNHTRADRTAVHFGDRSRRLTRLRLPDLDFRAASRR